MRNRSSVSTCRTARVSCSRRARTARPTTHTASDICSQHPTKKAQSCILDSGGPVVRRFGSRWELVGITSRDGDEKTDPNCVGPGVWTDAAAYRTWIRRTTSTSS
ncbi:hypothetical protein GCM10009733_031090 [Nonomuraea maheshkhaliensis]|uniref:Peptidase S1 domain-containing protein n=1 Tax=Nonomuraea maheshkhaliensis TaxID=419590 RepID=A0ABP4R1B0_9ACTN